jgi:hypothetical protein
MSLKVQIEYSESFSEIVPIDQWEKLPPEDVQSFTVFSSDKYKAVFHGTSMYYLYPEGDNWVGGGASFGYDRTKPFKQVIFLPNGDQESREVKYIPCLPHKYWKVGWFKGEEVIGG